MIASRSPIASVEWTPRAHRSLARLLEYLCKHKLGNPEARAHEIEQQIDELRYAPLRCPVVGVRRGKPFRQLVVSSRFLVYYTCLPPNETEPGGTISIRSIKHGAQARPFLGVRDAPFDGLPGAHTS